MAKKLQNRGVTFVELLLTISIVGVIMMTIYQSTSYGMSVFHRSKNSSNMEAIHIMKQLGRELRSSFLISNKTPSISFSGTASSLKFVSAVSLEHDFLKEGGFDLKQYRYSLQPGERNGITSLIHAAEDVFMPNAGSNDVSKKGSEKQMSASIKSMMFSFFDGEEWKPSWNSHVHLPQAVRISIQFQSGKNVDPLEFYSTVIHIPGA